MLRIDFEPSEALYPFESQWYESSVGPIHYIDEGEGDPVLFLHGNPTWSFLYRDVIRRLCEDFRCIAVDYPGFGLSVHPDDYGYSPREHAEVVSELVEELGLEELVVMGQDWGGPIGTAVALEHRESMRGLCMGNTWYWPTDRLATKLFSWGLSTKPMQWAILEKNLFVERFLPMGTAGNLSAEVMDHYRAVQPRSDARVGTAEFPRQLTAAAGWLREHALRVERSLTRLPLLLTWGMRDPAFTSTHFLPRWQREFSEVRTVELDDASHFIQEDAPHEIADAIYETFG